MKFICFPHAGGFASYYSFFKNADLFGITDVIVYEYPGRGLKFKEKPFTNLNSCSSFIADEIAPKVENERFVLFGHSMGAFLAYEIGLRLQRKYGKYAKMVFISGQKPPVKFEKNHYSVKTNEQLMSYLLELGGIPPLLLKQRELLKQCFDMTKQDICMLHDYVPSLPSNCERLRRAAILYGDKDPEIVESEINLWSLSVTDICGVKAFKGSHFYFKENEGDLIKFINNILENVDS